MSISAFLTPDMLTFLIGLVAVMNPVGNAAIYLSLVASKTRKEQHRVALRCAIAVAVILVIVTWVGLKLLQFFGISVGAFKVAGGLAVLLIGLNMLRSNVHAHPDKSDAAVAKAKHGEHVGVVPLAIPIVAGPGAMSTLIAHAPLYNTLLGKTFVSFFVILVAALVGLIFWTGPYIAKALGDGGMRIAVRIMGLILSAIAIQMMSGGVHELFHLTDTDEAISHISVVSAHSSSTQHLVETLIKKTS